MARKAPGEARAQTRKARKATGNPRKVKESAELASQAPSSVSGEGGTGRTGTTGAAKAAVLDPRERARARAAEARRAMREGLPAEEMTEEEARAGEMDPADFPDGFFAAPQDEDSQEEESFADADLDSDADSDVEEIGTIPNPNIKTEGQIKRAAKAVKKVEKERRRKIIRRIIIVVVLLLLAALVALCVLFGMHRWNTYDDAEDFIGTWYVEDSDLPIVITEDKIELTDGVAYSYKLDPESKTITFKFGNMTGQGRYRFSLDRQQLSIMDGPYEYWDTLLDDAAWTLQAVIRDLQGLSMLNPSLEANTLSTGTLTLLKKPNAEATALPEGSVDEDGDPTLLDGAGSGEDDGDAGGSGTSTGGDAGGSGGSSSSGSSGGGPPSGMGFTDLDINDL